MDRTVCNCCAAPEAFCENKQPTDNSLGIHVVTMYRWGSREKHSYILGGYKTKNSAISAGEKESSERGCKYEFEVVSLDKDGKIVETYSDYNINDGTIDEWTAREENKKLCEALLEVIQAGNVWDNARHCATYQQRVVAEDALKKCIRNLAREFVDQKA